MLQAAIAFLAFTNLIIAHSSALNLNPKETRYSQWFPQYHDRFQASAELCQVEIHNYRHSVRTPQCSTPCSCAADCILANSTETMKANMGSAGVLLGLMPVILPFVGPSLAEVAALSVQRPFLALLLSIGTPSVQISQLFAPLGVQEIFRGESSTTTTALLKSLRKSKPRVWIWISLLEYILVGASILGQLTASVALSLKTIVSWRCGAFYLVFFWLTLSVAPHAAGALSFWLNITITTQPTIPKAPKRDPAVGVSCSGAFSHLKMWPTKLINICRPEFHSCSSPHYTRAHSIKITPSAPADLFIWLASILALAHTLFGILLFSAILFISTFDALTIILGYMFATGLCRIVILFELAGLRAQKVLEVK